MKKLLIVVMSAAVLSASFTAFAAQDVSNPAGLQKIGTVSDASGSLTLNELENKLRIKAEKEGAASYHITSAGGKNTLYGTADIYR
ncbi:multiple stress resistance protein BhsA [Salmonella enterica subsp. enterica serovar Choleraesuis]|nr:multiple stress resistance protein BhsA [Salmonella enterica subsp. enterica serovar Choleraesuis]